VFAWGLHDTEHQEREQAKLLDDSKKDLKEKEKGINSALIVSRVTRVD